MPPIALLIIEVIQIYIYVLIAWVILSWLVAFNVVNTRHPFVNAVARFLHAATVPVLRPIQRRVPSIGGVDISPLILVLGLWFVQRVVGWYVHF